MRIIWPSIILILSNFLSHLSAKKDLGHENRFLYRMPICLSRPLDCSKEETFFNSTGEVRMVFIYFFRSLRINYAQLKAFFWDKLSLWLLRGRFRRHKRMIHKLKGWKPFRISSNDYRNKKNYLFRIERDYDQNIILEFDRDYGFDIEFHNRIWSHYFYS